MKSEIEREKQRKTKKNEAVENFFKKVLTKIKKHSTISSVGLQRQPWNSYYRRKKQ